MRLLRGGSACTAPGPLHLDPSEQGRLPCWNGIGCFADQEFLFGLGGGPSSLAVGDVNGDGYLDIVGGGLTVDPLSEGAGVIHLNDGAGRFEEAGELRSFGMSLLAHPA